MVLMSLWPATGRSNWLFLKEGMASDNAYANEWESGVLQACSLNGIL